MVATEQEAGVSGVTLIAVPYHHGIEENDRGQGPRLLLRAAEASGALGPNVVVETLTLDDEHDGEAARVFALNRRLAERVRVAAADGRFPLIVAGDCNACLGVAAGAGGDRRLGVVWLDAHGDFEDPETSIFGAMDGMSLALLTGRGWAALRTTVDGLQPVDEGDVVLIGVRDVEPGQWERLCRSRVHRLKGAGHAPAGVRETLDALARRVDRVYLHVDLDALDPSEGAANQYAVGGGLSAAETHAVIEELFARCDVAGAAVTAYHPPSDRDGRMAETATGIIAAIADRSAAVPERPE